MKNIQAKALLLLLFTTFISFGQGNAGNSVKISGQVLEKDTNQPLEFATVTIQTTDETTVNGGLTDVNGEYSIDVPPGIYNIKFDFISFKSVVISAKEINSNTNLGVTAMAPDATLLNEVEIVAERSTVDIKLDKRVYNVGEDMIVRGGTVSDVLDNVPSVSVDVEGNVSLRGNESVTILIDGRPSNLAGGNIAEVLRLLPADAVEKVEVITNPSARYDAEGGGGIINIVLKKGKATGFNGSIVATTGYPDNHSIAANLNFRGEKFNVFSNLNYSYRDNPGNAMTDSEYLDENGNTTGFINERRTNNRLRRSYNGTFGMEWFLNESTTWTNSVAVRKSNGTNPTETYFDNFTPNGDFEFTRFRYNLEDEKDDNVRYSTNLTKKFNDEGHELRIDATIAKNLDYEVSRIDDVVLGTTTPETDNRFERTLNDEDETRSLLQADYVLPFGEGNQFEAGYRGSFTDLTTNSIAETLGNDGNWIENPDFTNLLEYKEYVNALYAQFGSKVGKFSYLLGLRWEDTNIEVNLLNRNEYNDKIYNNFFPSAFLTYEFSEQSSANISYSRRINRPRGRWINPFSSLASNINIFQGNPDLDPSMTDAFDVGYLKRWNKLTFSTSAYFNLTNDSFQFVRRVSGTTDDGVPITLVTPVNLAKEYRFGFEFNLNYNPYRWWRLNGNFNFFRNETDGDYTFSYTDQNGDMVTNFQNFDFVAYSWFARLNSKVNLPWKIDWQLNGFYAAPQDNAQGRTKSILSANTALSKDVLNERATIGLNVSDIFNSRKRRMYTNLPEVNSYSEMQWRERQITLSFTYRFNMNKNERERAQQREQEEGGEEFMGG